MWTLLGMAWRGERRRVGGYLARALVLLGLVLYLIKDIVPWSELPTLYRDLGPVAAALGLAAFSVLAGLLLRPTLSRVLFGPQWNLWRRSPLSPYAWTPAVGSLSLVAVAPFTWVGAVLHGSIGGFMLWTAAAMLCAIGLASRRAIGLLGLALVLPLLGMEAMLVMSPSAAWWLGATALLWAGAWAGPLRQRIAGVPMTRLASLPGRPRSKLAAMVRWDVLFLARRSPGALWIGVLPALSIGGWLYGMQHHGWTAWARSLGALIMLCLFAPLLAAVAQRLVQVRGPGLYRGRWSVGASARATSLVMVLLLLLTPSLASAAAVGAMTPIGHARVGAMALCIASSAVAVALADRPQGAMGRYLWYLVGLLLIAMLDPISPTGLIAVALGCWLLVRHRLLRWRTRP